MQGEQLLNVIQFLCQ